MFTLNVIFTGILMGLTYALMALGLTLIFSIVNIINFAHGEFYILGGYFFCYLTRLFGVPHFLSFLISVAIVFIIGVLFKLTFLQELFKEGKLERPIEYTVLITFGFSIFLQHLVLSVFGPFPKSPIPMVSGVTSFGSIIFINDRLIIAAVSLLGIFLLFYVLFRTWFGKALRALAQDQVAASVSGIDLSRFSTLAFGIGVSLAAAAGALISSIMPVTPDAGLVPAIRSYIIVVLAGLGSVPGAAIGGIIIGLIENLGVAILPPAKSLAYKPIFSLIVFIIILIIKPTGLFGREG